MPGQSVLTTRKGPTAYNGVRKRGLLDEIIVTPNAAAQQENRFTIRIRMVSRQQLESGSHPRTGCVTVPDDSQLLKDP